MIRIEDFELEHFKEIDMRDHEREQISNYQIEIFKTESIESKTVYVNDEIVCCYGLFDNNGLWLVPSNKINDLPVKFARGTVRVLKELLDGKEGVHSICLNDDLHKRWMRFLGFVETSDPFEINGHEHLMFERL